MCQSRESKHAYMCACVCVCMCAGVRVCVCEYLHEQAHLLVGREVLEVLERHAPGNMRGSIRLQRVALVVCCLRVHVFYQCVVSMTRVL